MTPAEEKQATLNTLAHLDESDRLKKLSDIDLIRECAESEVSLDPIVQEMMNRLDHNWIEEI